jgi:two-component system CheB/CheR fusion protein
VDDTEDMLLVSRSLLEVNGAIVFAASNALDGLAILEKEKVDLLISDVSMPAIDGYAFLRRVRKGKCAVPGRRSPRLLIPPTGRRRRPARRPDAHQ